jgi:hypothetical protein
MTASKPKSKPAPTGIVDQSYGFDLPLREKLFGAVNLRFFGLLDGIAARSLRLRERVIR